MIIPWSNSLFSSCSRMVVSTYIFFYSTVDDADLLKTFKARLCQLFGRFKSHFLHQSTHKRNYSKPPRRWVLQKSWVSFRKCWNRCKTQVRYLYLSDLFLCLAWLGVLHCVSWSHDPIIEVDVFSYAMVIYEIVCREVPFEEEEPTDVGKYTLAGDTWTKTLTGPRKRMLWKVGGRGFEIL